jgi:cellobiose phosphorylase
MSTSGILTAPSGRQPSGPARHRWINGKRHKLDAWWEEQFSAYQCDIPDAAAQRLINTWNVINSVQTGRYSRAINQVAPGVRGVGFRDTCQDMLAIAYRRPQWASRTLKQLLGYQYRDGHVVHMFDPQTGEIPSTSVHSDDHLWLPLVVYAILAETGDFSLLDESVPYLGEDGSGTDGDGTVWEHLMAGIRFTEAHLGKHGLPLNGT